MVSIAVSLNNLIAAILALSFQDRAKVAQALIQSELRSDLNQLLTELYSSPAHDDVTDEEILTEVRAVRQLVLEP